MYSSTFLAQKADPELIKIFLQGYENAFGTLVERYYKKVYSRILMKVKNEDVANDICQDAAVKALDSIRRGKYEEKNRFYYWYIRICDNLVIDYFRQQKKLGGRIPNDNPYYEFKEDMYTDDDPANFSDQRELSHLKDTLSFYMNELSEEQRVVLKLRYYQCLSFKEIAVVIGKSINTALGRERYAKRNLRKKIHDDKCYNDILRYLEYLSKSESEDIEDIFS